MILSAEGGKTSRLDLQKGERQGKYIVLGILKKLIRLLTTLCDNIIHRSGDIDVFRTFNGERT
jgi:hypothetical protein